MSLLLTSLAIIVGLYVVAGVAFMAVLGWAINRLYRL